MRREVYYGYMDSQTPQTESETTQPITPEPKRSRKGILVILLVLLLVVAVIGGVYYWQHQKVNDLTAQVNTLNAEVASLKKTADSSNTTQTTDEQVTAAATTYCAARVDPTTAKTATLHVGTMGADQLKIEYSKDKNFAAMNVSCTTTGETEGGGIEYILKKVNNQWVVITQRQQDNPEIDKLYGIPAELTE